MKSDEGPCTLPPPPLEPQLRSRAVAWGSVTTGPHTASPHPCLLGAPNLHESLFPFPSRTQAPLPYTGRTPAVLVTLLYHAPPRPSPFSFAAPPSHCTRTLTCLLETFFAIQFSRVPRCPPRMRLPGHPPGPTAVLLWTGEWSGMGSGSPVAVGWCRSAFRSRVCPCCYCACFHGGAANVHCSGRQIR